MSSKQQQAALLAVAMQLVGCVCAVMLALCAALGVTLMREGHYAASLQKGEYFDYVQSAALQGCTRQAQQAGLSAAPIESRVTPEAVRAGVLHRADALWHGATQDATSPFSGLSTEYQDTLGSSPADSIMLELACEEQWHNATAAPLSAVLASMQQYRWVLRLSGWLCALLLAGCGVLQFLLAECWNDVQQGVQRIALGTAAACAVMGLVLYFGTGWQSWMPVSDPAYQAFCCWFGGFPPAMAACGVLLAVMMCIMTECMKNLTE